jgi:hypothetical protein
MARWFNPQKLEREVTSMAKKGKKKPAKKEAKEW